MDILAEIAAFDGKHTDVLETLGARLVPEPPIIQELCEIAQRDEAKFQAAATWLLKRFQEGRASFSSTHVVDILNLFNHVTYWEARLHLLQMLPEFTIPATQKELLHRVLLDGLNDTNKFVRAWSYQGLASLAEQYDEFRAEVIGLLEVAQQEEAASVKARIRNIRKKAKWTGST